MCRRAPYSDVSPTAYYAAPVAALAEDGIFGGTLCNDGFCPDQAIDRKTMAVWVVRVLDGEDPAPPSQARFDDVDIDSFYAPFIERMFDLDVTRGCGDASGFCPDRTVTRAQMAVFLSRAYGLPDVGPGPGFIDVAGDAWYAADVARLAASGITTGCGDGTRFCPGRDTTRAQMATFLHRAENPEESQATVAPDVQLNPAMDGGGRIAAGHGWCAVMTSGTLTCRDRDGLPESDTPEGKFTAVDLPCAIRTDSTITCWGGSGVLDAPEGKFTAVSSPCAISTDSTMTCWGSDGLGLADAPEGKFIALSYGFGYACAIRTDSTITCWGGSGVLDAPEGKFTAVSVPCAIRTDSSITCWGDDRTAAAALTPPPGEFVAVAGGIEYACAIRTDSTITCWGSDDNGRTVAPSGEFIALSSVWRHACAIRTNGAITCWGGGVRSTAGSNVNDDDAQQPGDDTAVLPGGEVISAGKNLSCGILADRTVACWGSHQAGQQEFALGQFLPSGRFIPAEGPFVAVSVGYSHSCGLLADQTITCSGSYVSETIDGRSLGEAHAPAGRFLAVSAGRVHSCGLLANQTVACWGENDTGKTDAPSGRFRAVSAGGFHSCGLRLDQTVACWGRNDAGLTDAPSGRFRAVSAGHLHSCGLRLDQTVTCWGSDLGFDFSTQQNYHDGRTEAPAGRFLAVSAGVSHSCGLRADETVTCWGGNYRGQRDAPSGRFRAVSAGYSHSCGLRPDQTVTCWGIVYSIVVPRLRFLSEADTTTSASVLIPRTVDCQRQTTSSGEPGPPVGVEIVRINILDAYGRLAQPATLGWTSPCSGGTVDHYVVQWRRGHEDFGSDRQHIAQSAGTESYLLEIPDLHVYAVRITAVNRHGQSRSAEVIVPTPANDVRALLERVVATFEDRYPWLREVGNQINTPDFEAHDVGGTRAWGSSGISIGRARYRVSTKNEQEASQRGWILDLIGGGPGAVHEMAHVYHSMTDLAVNPPAIAAGWMYFDDFLKDIPKKSPRSCRTAELYADAPGMLMYQDGLTTHEAPSSYWAGCTSPKGSTSSFSWLYEHSRWQEWLNVMRSVYVDQKVPQWFYDTYQQADGTWDVDAIKEALEQSEGRYTIYRQLRQLIPELQDG